MAPDLIQQSLAQGFPADVENVKIRAELYKTLAQAGYEWVPDPLVRETVDGFADAAVLMAVTPSMMPVTRGAAVAVPGSGRDGLCETIARAFGRPAQGPKRLRR
jgi:hypothetical protein